MLIIVLVLDTPEMIITRPFAPTDVSTVIKIVEESLGENYPPSLYLTVHNLWMEGFLLLIEDGSVVGFVAAVPSGTRVARVLMLAVLPGFRNKSLGKTLMSELSKNCVARGIDTIVLEVRKSNKIALSFYESLGFSVFGEIKKFYSNGEDAYKMMKVLES